MGLPWQEQKPSKPITWVIAEIRRDIHSGHFDTKDWDHNHPNRVPGRSNKQVWLSAKDVLGRPPASMVEAWRVMIELAVGPIPQGDTK